MTIRYNTIQYNTILYYTILYYTILYYTILYYTILYYTILYYTILYLLYNTILYYTLLFYTLLYCTILYYTILYSTLLCFYQRLLDAQPPLVAEIVIDDVSPVHSQLQVSGPHKCQFVSIGGRFEGASGSFNCKGFGVDIRQV